MLICCTWCVLHATFVCMAFWAISACPAIAELYLQACPGQVEYRANIANLASIVTYYFKFADTAGHEFLCALTSSCACA